MAKPAAHMPIPARLVATLNGVDYDLATFELDIPVHVKLGEQGINKDGERYVAAHPYLEPGAVEKAIRKAFRHVHVGFAL